MKKTLKTLPLLCLGISQMCFAYSNEERTVLDTFAWFNQISDVKREPFDHNSIAAHFSPDAKMITNNKVACQGIAEHFEHFVEINKHFESMYVDLNNIEMHSHGDRVYLDYIIHAVNEKHQAQKLHIMGYMVVKDKRITLFKEVAALEDVLGQDRGKNSPSV